MTALLNNPALMRTDRAKRTGAKTTTMAGNAKLNFGNGRNTAGFIITRMPGPLIRQRIYAIHFPRIQRQCRGQLNQKSLAVFLNDGMSTQRVLFQILHFERRSVIRFAGRNLLMGRHFQRIDRCIRQTSCQETGSAHISNFADGNSIGQVPCNLQDL